MKTKANRKNLHAILSAVQPGLSSREIIEQSTCFIFNKGQVLTYNDEIAVSHPIDLELEGAVQAKELMKLLEKMKDEEIEIETTESEMIVWGMNSETGIKLETKTNVDAIVEVLGKMKGWKDIHEKFWDNVSFCLFSTGRDVTKPLLTCVSCTEKHIMSTDEIRITVCDLDKSGVANLNIPASAMHTLLSYHPTEIALSKGWAHFKNESGAIFSCRTMEGDYPNEKILSIIDNIKGDEVSLPTDLVDALERAGIFATSSDQKVASAHRVQIEINNNKLTVRGEGQKGRHKEVSRLRYKGPSLEFEINPDFLRDILKHATNMIVGDRALRFEGENFVHVIRTAIPKAKK